MVVKLQTIDITSFPVSKFYTHTNTHIFQNKLSLIVAITVIIIIIIIINILVAGIICNIL